MPPQTLTSLPPELLLTIASFLDPPSACSLRLVSHSTNSIATSQALTKVFLRYPGNANLFSDLLEHAREDLLRHPRTLIIDAVLLPCLPLSLSLFNKTVFTATNLQKIVISGAPPNSGINTPMFTSRNSSILTALQVASLAEKLTHLEVWDIPTIGTSSLINARCLDRMFSKLHTLRLGFDYSLFIPGGAVLELVHMTEMVPIMWLPKALNITRLTLSRGGPWGLDHDFSGLKFPNLEQLTMEGWQMFDRWQLQWLRAHRFTLTHLVLVNCTITFNNGPDFAAIPGPGRLDPADYTPPFRWCDLFRVINIYFHLEKFAIDMPVADRPGVGCECVEDPIAPTRELLRAVGVYVGGGRWSDAEMKSPLNFYALWDVHLGQTMYPAARFARHSCAIHEEDRMKEWFAFDERDLRELVELGALMRARKRGWIE